MVKMQGTKYNRCESIKNTRNNIQSMSIQVVPLQEDHLPKAAELVCSRYRALHERLPILPGDHTSQQTILKALQDLYPEAEGIAAWQDGCLVGFMTGIVLDDFLGRRCAYSLEWGNATTIEDSRLIYEEMYTQISKAWIDQGCYSHLISIMAGDPPAIEAFHWLGFGLINIDGVRDLAPVPGPTSQLRLKRAGVGDLPDLMEMGKALERHVYSAPTFWEHEMEDYPEWINSEQNAAWLAYAGDECTGFTAFEPGTSCECMLLRHESTIRISGAYTIPQARGQGVARLLLNQGLAWAQSKGYTRCAVDFESANTLARRFWTRWFEPVNYSMLRCVDERIHI
jgi:GNAT superfamily N-acetyltransferase